MNVTIINKLKFKMDCNNVNRVLKQIDFVKIYKI